MGWSRLALAGLCAGNFAAAQFDPELVGTWTTSSRSVLTGPGFYNPTADKFTEPDHTGISYSFTENGWYEEAYYRAISNPADPGCPSGVMQWQHGQYVKNSNGSLTLTPISNDGRMLESVPCENAQTSLYTHYSQWELFQWYEIVQDEYHGVKRLNLYQFDGSPMNPMFLYYYPTPQMLPTSSLHQTSATAAPTAAPTSNKQKRTLADKMVHPSKSRLLDPDLWWWSGATMTALGALCYFVF